jgi:hypothetical protein
MSVSTIKEYGLKFIEEMSKDRALAKQEIAVAIESAKTTYLRPDEHLTFKSATQFADHSKEKVLQVIDSELNRITIKSLGRIRQILTTEKLLPEALPSSDISQEEMIKLENEVQRLQNQMFAVIQEKNEEIRLKQKEAGVAQTSIASYEKQLNSSFADIRSLNAKLLAMQEENLLVKKNMDELLIQIALKENLIKKLTEQNKISQQDVANAISSVENAYKSNEEFYSKYIQESVDQSLHSAKREFETKIEDLKKQLAEEQKKSEELAQQQTKMIQLLEQDLLRAKEEVKTLQEKLSVQSGPRFQGVMVLNYIQRVLSTHPLYSAMLILINLGGSMNIVSLAKSVGVHPLKLRQMLEEFEEKGLVKISKEEPAVVEIVNI